MIILQVVSVVDKFWVSCQLDLRTGLVPAANVSPITLSQLRPGQRICVARSGYIAQHTNVDMDIKKGNKRKADLLHVRYISQHECNLEGKYERISTFTRENPFNV